MEQLHFQLHVTSNFADQALLKSFHFPLLSYTFLAYLISLRTFTFFFLFYFIILCIEVLLRDLTGIRTPICTVCCKYSARPPLPQRENLKPVLKCILILLLLICLLPFFLLFSILISHMFFMYLTGERLF